jgi:Zn-dependent metalloprotease
MTNTRYGCVCFAVPHKLLKHLADKSTGDRKKTLDSNIEHMSQLRGERATHSVDIPPGSKGKHAIHRKVFDAQGQTMLPGAPLRDEGEPPVHDKTANHAYDNVGIALDFYKAVLGRESVDGRGMRIDASIHYGMQFGNAMWTGRQMIVGDGDGHDVVGIANSLGLIAHELSHGVTQHLVKGALGVVLEPGCPPALKGEAGALNESFSDVFASMIKQWHAGVDVREADWLIGEDVMAPHAGKAVRSLKDPGNKHLTWAEDDQIKDYRHYRPGDDPHSAAGIANHAFYLAATRLGGKSWESLGAVWFNGYSKLHSKATFKDAAHATSDVAAALHGKGSETEQAVRAAWKQVNVTS